MKTTTADITRELDEAIMEIMGRLEAAEGIQTGDISPWQSFLLDGYIEKAAGILMEVLEDNRRKTIAYLKE